jgi:hypothetical protein
MIFRTLRVAWSLWCGLFALFLIVLMVRSFWRMDTISVARGTQTFALSTNRAEFHFITTEMFATLAEEWKHTSVPSLPNNPFIEIPLIPSESSWGFAWSSFGNGWQACGPLWPALFLLAMLTGVAWVPFGKIPRRFSIRTMLVATTLVAAALGLAVYFWRG